MPPSQKVLENSVLLPQTKDLLLDLINPAKFHPPYLRLTLGIFFIPGNIMETVAFLRRQLNLCCQPTPSQPIKLTNQHGKSGTVGVVQRKLVLFAHHWEIYYIFWQTCLTKVMNTARSVKIDGFTAGWYPDVCLLLKGISTQRPPKPKYNCIWNVFEVLTYVNNMGGNEHLSLKQLTPKTCFLIAITCPERVDILASFKWSLSVVKSHKLVIHLDQPRKKRKLCQEPEKPMDILFY